jgi:SH3-like domain-containing protein
MWKFARVSPGTAMLQVVLTLLVALATPVRAPAQPILSGTVGPETNLPMPRYVSLRGGEVNVRRGPGLEYRIDWVFQRRGLPVRIIDEYGNWRLIADSDDAGGWVYHALLTAKRTALITAPEVSFRVDPDDGAAATAKAEQGVVARLRPSEAELSHLLWQSRRLRVVRGGDRSGLSRAGRR